MIEINDLKAILKERQKMVIAMGISLVATIILGIIGLISFVTLPWIAAVVPVSEVTGILSLTSLAIVFSTFTILCAVKIIYWDLKYHLYKTK